ncbi:MAG TPA: hypothetical protein VGR78_19225, partial [Verrucomicrobiae bacterium]|nr:hypothetical protein [Verrucomicrobiae bacterium]
MDKFFKAGWLMMVAGISVQPSKGDNPKLDIVEQYPNVTVTITGGPGLHRLLENDALGVQEWSPVSPLSTRTNITFPKKIPAAFFRAQAAPSNDVSIYTNATSLLEQGRTTFRHDTLGNESFWGGALKLHQAISGTNHGGVGPGVSPKTALSVGLKVDVDALPESLKQALAQGKVDLEEPANTLALLELDSVVGVKGIFDNSHRMFSLGIQCALCHSTVDNSFAPGLGHRLDGWPNRDLNVGAIVNLSPDLSAFTNALGVDEGTVRTVLQSWGPGKFDAELILDGKAFRPDGKSAGTVLPAAFGLAGVNLST